MKLKTLLYRIALVLVLVLAAVSVFFLSKVTENDQLLGDLIDRSLAHRSSPGTRIDTVRALSEAIYQATDREIDRESLSWFDRWESLSPFNMSSAASLKYGAFGVRGHSVVGPCGTMSRVLLNALWRVNIPARKLQLLSGTGHTMVEFFDGGRWVVISPSDRSFIWHRADGTPATVEEIKADERVFRQVFESRPGFAYNFDATTHIRWKKIPQALQETLILVMGKEGFMAMETPRLYDAPRTLLLLVSLVLAVMCGVAALLLRRSLKKRSAVEAGYPEDVSDRELVLKGEEETELQEA